MYQDDRKRLIKFDSKTNREYDYGFLSERDIALETRGYKYDKKFGVYTRRGSRYGYYTQKF